LSKEYACGFLLAAGVFLNQRQKAIWVGTSKAVMYTCQAIAEQKLEKNSEFYGRIILWQNNL
jgi:hypothetical protein